LKKAEGNVTLVVCNASKGEDSTGATPGKEKDNKAKEETKKEPEKPSQFYSSSFSLNLPFNIKLSNIFLYSYSSLLV
jgi:hypothetical protein